MRDYEDQVTVHIIRTKDETPFLSCTFGQVFFYVKTQGASAFFTIISLEIDEAFG